MTRDDIIRLAKEAAAWDLIDHDGITALERFATLVAEREREACAKVCDEVECGSSMMIEERQTANECARKIRARGQS